ncbi:hypothetical protein Q7P36_002505 [Cladosporium allicinum]
MTRPRIEIELSDNESNIVADHNEQAEADQSLKIKQEDTPTTGVIRTPRQQRPDPAASINAQNNESELPTSNDATELPMQELNNGHRDSKGPSAISETPVATANTTAERCESRPEERQDEAGDRVQGMEEARSGNTEDGAGLEDDEPEDEEPGDESLADKDRQHKIPSIVEDNPGSPRQRQPIPLHDAERVDEEREFNDREHEMLETLDNVHSLPEQPSLDRGVLERAPKSQKKKVIAAAKPILATVTAATSRRVGPVLPPVPPTTREIFKDLVVKQKLKGRALYKKVSDVVDDRGRLSKALASWIIETDDDGAYLMPESFWSGISHIKNSAAANTTILNAGGKVCLRRQNVRVQGHDSTTGRFTAADSQAQLTKLGNELVHRSRVLGEDYGDLESLQREN